LAFQLLYQDELNPPERSHAGLDGAQWAPETGALEALTKELYEATLEDNAENEGDGTGTEGEVFHWPGSPELLEFTRFLIEGVRRHREQLDEQLAALAHNWRIERMAVTDRTILRLAAFEILHAETPDPVAVDEAIELAKRFGSAQSGQFVNGILDRVMHSRTETDQATAGQ
jgi:transcription antitermination factor NusB